MLDREVGDLDVSKELSVRNNPAWQSRKWTEKRALSVLEDDIFLGKRLVMYSVHLSTWSIPRDHWELLPSSIPLGWLCDTPIRNGSQVGTKAEVEDSAARKKDIESIAAEERTNGATEEEGVAPTRRPGLIFLHRM